MHMLTSYVLISCRQVERHVGVVETSVLLQHRMVLVIRYCTVQTFVGLGYCVFARSNASLEVCHGVLW